MIRSKDNSMPMAAQFEHIVLPNSDGGFTTRLYAVEGRPGVWKRIALNEKQDGSIKAWFDDGFIRLARAEAVEKELIEAMQVAKEEDRSPIYRETA